MNKERIIETACSLFGELGIKMTMDDIAQKAGVSKKTLYIHFENKEDLMRAAVFHTSSQLNRLVTEMVARCTNPIEQLYQAQRFFSCQEVIKKNSPQKQLQKFYPQIYKEFQERQLKEIGNLILKNLQKGIDEGCYRKDIYPEFTMRLYMHIMIEAGNDLPYLTGAFDEDFIGKTYLEYHIRSIATPKGLTVLDKILKSETIQ